MTQDEIIEMAIQARLVARIDECHRAIRPKWIVDHDITIYVQAFAKLVAEKAFDEGFYAGFEASGEGWNGELPFQYKGLDIRKDKSVQHELKEATRARKLSNDTR